MQTAANARQQSSLALSGATYIDILISGATLSGAYTINVDGTLVSPTEIATLTANGYNVGRRLREDNPNFPTYIISW